MKPTFALSIAALLTMSACATGDYDTADESTVFKGGGGGNPPPPTNLVSVAVTPSPLPGGHPSSGIITLSGPQGNGGGRYSIARPTTSSSVPPQIFVKSNFGGQSGVFNL
jgi:hypothetical protein